MTPVWRHIAQSVPGRSHSVAGTPCQDNHRVRLLGEGSAAALVACVADGAGSAECSQIGSELACESIMASAEAHYAARGRFNDVGVNDVLQWCEAARQAIDARAQLDQRELRDYATTLCVALLACDAAVLFQIGDGAIVLRHGTALGVVFWPQSGEYVNTTNFLTSSDFREQIQIELSREEFSEAAVLTDGLERLALRFDTFTPHAPFFDPLFKALRESVDLGRLAGDLGQLLQSDFVRNKNDDDKSLVLASRVALEAADAG